MSTHETKALPDPKEVARIYAEVAQRASDLIAGHIKRQMKRGVPAPSDELGIAQAFMDMTAKMLANPYKMARAQMNLVWDYFSLWQHSMLRSMGLHGAPVAAPKKGDHRFKDAQWEEHFLFDFVKQSYLITASHIHAAVSNVEGLEDISKKKVDFFTRQFIDALSPSNFAATNPAVLRETVTSHGQNLLKGFNNLLRDIEEGDGQLRVKMTDPSAFEMGRNVAVTPGKVVFQNEMIQLIQFNPTTREQYQRPLLIIPPWINKYYILDLRESNSFIKWATDQGHSVFVISWVNPDAKLAQKGFDDYLSEGALAAIDAVCRQTGEKEVNLIGYCLGGTLLGSTMGYMAAKKDKRIASATFFVALLDFSIPGELGVFIDEAQVAKLEKKMEKRGFLEGSEMGGTFNMLRSNDLIWSFVVNNYLMGKDPFPFDLLYWNSDSTRMPCKMHSFYLRNMYLNNLLREPGGITLLDTPIDLSKVKTPSYFISTLEDHIAPWRSVYLGATVLGGPVRFALGGSGHIAGIVNPPAANKYGFWTNDAKALPETPDEWFEGARQHEGSWWTDWQKWISGLNDARVPARDPAKGKLKPLEDAPGSFVRFRLDAQKKKAK
ncbi:MAG: class I poly(R)-hydroxyalkanoic acid synthase [Sulfuritalea sp.]|jgi:polyhydroxyalkanoate synthase|nr:class I poly(R)-hydroxyalkanoic acid synthase [Sulfuritalea sp.]